MTTEDNFIELMFKAGAHFGYSKTRRNPSTDSYIFTTKNRVDIIDLEKTKSLLSNAQNFIKELRSKGKQILFVGTKPEARKAVAEAALALEMPYVTERWIGGTLTNFPEIRKRISRLEELKELRSKGELEKYTKKERLKMDEEIEKMTKNFSGLVTMKKIPDAVFIVDTRHEDIALSEAKKSGLPVIGLASSDCDIKEVDYPIIANDPSILSISLFLKEIVKAYQENIVAA